MSFSPFRRTCAAFAVCLLAACRGDAPTESAPADAPVTITAALAGTNVQALTVLVTGPAITVPVVANVETAADTPTATLTMQVPVGGQRTFVARGYDGEGVLTHEGMTTVVVRPSGNAPLAIRLYARTGDVPVTVGISRYSIVITPATLADAYLDETRQLTASVFDASGTPIPGAIVRWGSLNPRVAEIGSAGLVTPRVAGTTTLYASYEGASASIDFTVLGPTTAYRDVATGDGFTCALDQQGALWCWGGNVREILGVNGPPALLRPVSQGGTLRFTSISATANNACGRTEAGDAWCWGDGFAFGDGIADNMNAPFQTPRRAIGGHVWRQVAAGPNRTCGIATTGELWCWGWGSGSNIAIYGGPTSGNAWEPRLVTQAPGPWATVSIAKDIACGIRLGGAAVCANDPSSVPITTASAAGYSWRDLRIGYATIDGWRLFGCGLTTDLEVRCWGAGALGQLGNGATPENLTTPTRIAGPQGWDAITAGGDFACALREGAAWCWGRNDAGQLGDGTLVNRSEPTRVSGGHVFARIEAGKFHACGIRTDGALYCWGRNDVGAIGDGTQLNRNTPRLVARPLSNSP